jgi:hypothetical protein
MDRSSGSHNRKKPSPLNMQSRRHDPRADFFNDIRHKQKLEVAGKAGICFEQIGVDSD